MCLAISSGFFSGNFGAPDEWCSLAVWMISCQKQIVSHCQCLSTELKQPCLRVDFSCVDVVPTVPHTDPVLAGAELTASSFLLGARRWWGMGCPVGWSPGLDYPPSSRVTAASSATKSFFPKFSVHAQCRALVVASPGSPAPQPLPEYSWCHRSGLLRALSPGLRKGLQEILPYWNIT